MLNLLKGTKSSFFCIFSTEEYNKKLYGISYKCEVHVPGVIASKHCATGCRDMFRTSDVQPQAQRLKPKSGKADDRSVGSINDGFGRTHAEAARDFAS